MKWDSIRILMAASVAALVSVTSVSVAEEPERGVYGAVMAGAVLTDGERDSKEIGANGQAALGYYITENVGLELSLFGQSTQRISDGQDDFATGFGLDLNVGEPEGVSPFFLVGGGIHSEDSKGQNYTSPFANLGVGLYLPLPNTTTLVRTEIRYNVILLDDQTPNAPGDPRCLNVATCDVDQFGDFRFNVGLQFGSGRNTDYVSITRLNEIAAAAAQKALDEKQPPPPPPDADNDGIPDEADQCPDSPPAFVVGKNGCVPDYDGDGVDESKDRCPGTPPAVTVDELGCEPKPVVVPETPKDGDSDGVVDAADQCPNTAPGTVVNATGCPLPTDSDGDGVLDSADQCANTSKEYQVDEVGCVVVETVVLDSVSFASGGDKLSSSAQGALKAIAASLVAYPTMVVEVGGHSDSQGPESANLKLSQRRANAVRDYLIAQGVPGNRLVAEGYGEFQPIADNKTADGRAKNRRVEFKVLKQ